MKDNYNIAVISDLHVGPDSRAFDFCSDEDVKEGSLNKNKFIDQNYLSKFLDFVIEKKLSAKYLIISGDISTSATSSQFIKASEIITKISKALSILISNS